MEERQLGTSTPKLWHHYLTERTWAGRGIEIKERQQQIASIGDAFAPPRSYATLKLAVRSHTPVTCPRRKAIHRSSANLTRLIIVNESLHPVVAIIFWVPQVTTNFIHVTLVGIVSAGFPVPVAVGTCVTLIGISMCTPNEETRSWATLTTINHQVKRSSARL